jgi:hypothetical protein
MPATESTQARLMRERARALATLFLTRRPDVQIDDVSEDIGVDLIARLASERKPGLRQLGVELRYVLEPVTANHANKVLRPALQTHQAYGPFPFPVVLFFFTMRDDGGWYTWVAEPVVSAGGRAQLPLRDEPDCRPLDAVAVDDMIAQVDRWYDALYGELAAISAESKRAKKL